MRFSVERGDRAYDPSHSRRVKSVSVDGEPPLAMVLTADEEEGLVRHVAADPAGNPIITGGELTILETRGRVRIELMPKGERDWDSSRRGQTKVAVGRDRNGDLLVQVYSIARPGAIKQVRKDALTLRPDTGGLCQDAGLLAGYAAELLCAQFGDRIDPSECARTAVEQCLRMAMDGEGTVDGDQQAG